ncbi:MAG: hypothetical protein HYV63_24025 [Candidatus Schekmanbacteria bacterium]|nr:hypothetical protein [Candidatus Schekmanbacteria bacterium]
MIMIAQQASGCGKCSGARVRATIFVVALGAIVGAACQRGSVETDVGLSVKTSIYHVARADCNLLADVAPNRLGAEADSLKEQKTKVLGIGTIEMVHQGDELEVLGRHQSWARVRVRRTGRIGWLYADFIRTYELGEWWHGDTDRARLHAKRIFQDKFIPVGGYPIAHVTIEEAWNQLRFECKPDEDFPVEEAKDFAKHWLIYLKDAFPYWEDYFVTLTGYHDGQAFDVFLSDKSAEPHVELRS